MRLLFELSGEHPTLPAAEALALLDLRGGGRELARDEGVLVAETEADPVFLAARLGLTHRVDEHVAEVPPDPGAILEAVKALDARLGPRFRVRAHRLGEHGRALSPHGLARDAGAALAKGREVAFDGGADEVRILLGERAHVALLRAEVDRAALDGRHVRHRPFFSPISLHPRFARALVNLARVRPGDSVCDPFAGTGGVLLEAALCGARVVGADLDREMAEGALGALAHYGQQGEVWTSDVADALARAAPLDAVVSDPPYGRASTTAREPPRELYARFLEATARALRPGGRAAIVLPDAQAAGLAPPGLVLEQAHAQRVHRSLWRHYLVFRK